VTAGPAHRPLPFWVLFLYGLPAVALAIPTIPVYVYLPSFYATEIGLSLTAVGAAMLMARLLDVVTDPLIGVLADALPTRFGRRKPWIALGALIGGYAMMQLFMPAPGAGPGDLLLWAALLYLGWSLVAIPYAAWGAELSTDYHERARITSVREGASLLGVLAAGAVLAAGPRLGWTGGESQVAVGMLAIALGAPALAAMLWAVPEMGDVARQGPGQSRSARSLLAGLHRNRAFLRLIAAWFLNGLANGLPAALFPLYLTHGLRVGEELQGALIFGYFVSGVAAIPLWLRLSRRLGKHRAWCVAMLLCCAAFAVVPFIAAGDWPVFLAVCVVTGAALGADLALPPAMQADLVDYDAWKFSRPRPGILFALWSMASKMALAASVGIAFPVLDLLGFDAQAAVNTPQALLGLAVIYALVPVVIKLMTVALVWGHPLTERRHASIRRRLARRP
jgi:Na+/melibiose symporter-like transporter